MSSTDYVFEYSNSENNDFLPTPTKYPEGGIFNVKGSDYYRIDITQSSGADSSVMKPSAFAFFVGLSNSSTVSYEDIQSDKAVDIETAAHYRPIYDDTSISDKGKKSAVDTNIGTADAGFVEFYKNADTRVSAAEFAQNTQLSKISIYIPVWLQQTFYGLPISSMLRGSATYLHIVPAGNLYYIHVNENTHEDGYIPNLSFDDQYDVDELEITVYNSSNWSGGGDVKLDSKELVNNTKYITIAISGVTYSIAQRLISNDNNDTQIYWKASATADNSSPIEFSAFEGYTAIVVEQTGHTPSTDGVDLNSGYSYKIVVGNTNATFECNKCNILPSATSADNVYTLVAGRTYYIYIDGQATSYTLTDNSGNTKYWLLSNDGSNSNGYINVGDTESGGTCTITAYVNLSSLEINNSDAKYINFYIGDLRANTLDIVSPTSS